MTMQFPPLVELLVLEDFKQNFVSARLRTVSVLYDTENLIELFCVLEILK